MQKGLIGKKIGMTQLFDDNGNLIPVTVVKAGPCHIVQVKREEKEGYNAVQLGFEEKRANLMTKPELGHYENANVTPKRILKEFRIKENIDKYNEGDALYVDMFEIGEKVDVTGTSKGKGFQGTIKKYNFQTGPKTHGSHSVRSTGSVGASASPSRVIKGKKMPGRMGGKKITVRNLEVVHINKERDIIMVKGAIPGSKNGYVYITKK
jgi:large subunit ribosomal protein L3